MVSGKQRHLYTAVALFLLLVGQASAFAGGNGTPSNPYEISNVDQLQNMSSDLDAHYELVNNIDASETRDWNSGKGFDPIGDSNTTFRGTLNGNGYTISGLYIKRNNIDYVSLLGNLSSSSVVKNIGMLDVNISSGSYYVGGLVGFNDGGSISSSFSTGNVNGKDNVGGLVGSNQGSISSSFSTASVNGSYYVGGLVGFNNGGSISSSFSTGKIYDGDYKIGGLVGSDGGGGTSSDSYWDTETSGQSTSEGGTGLTTDEMTGTEAKSNMGGFDFSSTWKVCREVNSGYPALINSSVSCFVGGSGTESDPYEISSVGQLQKMAINLSAQYELVSDIDASETRNWNNGKGFKPVGEDFKGRLDGNGHTVNRLYINRSSDYIGIFGSVDDPGSVTNVGVTNVNISGNGNVGAIAGFLTGSLSKVYSTGSITGSHRLGGLTGYAAGSTKHSYSLADLEYFGDDWKVGGLAGISSGDVDQTYSAGEIYRGGGGGGGLVAYIEGGLVSSSYYDLNKSNSSDDVATPLTTSEMTRPDAEGNMTGFDFTDVWKTEKGCNDGYPFLRVFDGKVECEPSPSVESVTIRVNETSDAPKIDVDLSGNGQSDIASYQGLSSVSTFTNSSLEASVSFPFSGNISVSDFTGLSSQTRSVDLDRNDSGHRQDPKSASLSQQHLNQTYSLSNEGSDPVDYSLDLEIPGTLDSQEKWSGTLNAGSSTTHTAESYGDWIDEKLHELKPPEEVTLGKAFTASQVLEVTEQAGVSWDNVSISSTVEGPSQCSQANRTEISVSAEKTENKSIGFSCSSGSIGPSTDSVYDHGSYEKAWYNTTLTVASNLTENSSITYSVDKAELPKFSSRNPGSIKAVVNGKSEDVAVVEDEDKISVTVQDDFGNSSLHEGQHQASLTYVIPSEEPQTRNDSEYSITFSEEQYNTVIPGKTSTIIFTAFNYEPEPNQLYLETRDTKACQYFSIQTSYTGDEYGEESSLRLPASTRSGTNSTGDVILKAKVDVPNRTTLFEEGLGETFTCRFDTGAGIGEADSLNLTVKSVDTTPRWVEGVRELVPDLPETSLIYSTEVCLPSSSADVSRLEQVQKYLEEEECGGDLYSIPLPTGEASALIFGGFVLVYGVTKFRK